MPLSFAAWWARVGGSGDPWPALEAAWSSPGRVYHTLDHLADCISWLPLVDPAHHDLVEGALYFHDAVYDLQAHDNEEQSARMAERVCAGLPIAARLGALILATKHQAPPGDPVAGAVVDVDLAVLGRDEAGYTRYVGQVRQEYGWVPEDAWRAGRGAVLSSLLSRPIYSTAPFVERFEARARGNLAAELRRLQS